MYSAVNLLFKVAFGELKAYALNTKILELSIPPDPALMFTVPPQTHSD